MSTELVEHNPVMWCDTCGTVVCLNHEHEVVWTGKVEW